MLSKKWFDGLPGDLQKIRPRRRGGSYEQIVPFVTDFFAAQLKTWTARGGQLISLPAAEQETMIARISSIGIDLSQSEPQLEQAVKLVFEAAARNK